MLFDELQGLESQRTKASTHTNVHRDTVRNRTILDNEGYVGDLTEVCNRTKRANIFNQLQVGDTDDFLFRDNHLQFFTLPIGFNQISISKFVGDKEASLILVKLDTVNQRRTLIMLQG